MEFSTVAVRKLIERGITISAMESCTGGYFASCLTDVSGASDIFKGSFVTYSNEAKVMEGVPEDIIRTYGVYSAETAAAMAQACALHYHAKIGIGITGSLGRKDPYNPDSVSGQVFCCIRKDGVSHTYFYELPEELKSRRAMKEYIVNELFKGLDELLK